MASSLRDEIILPQAGESDDRAMTRSRVIAFVPITLALVGVAAVLFGGVSARDPATAIGAAKQVEQIDPIQTGSIAKERDRRRDLQMLDR